MRKIHIILYVLLYSFSQHSVAQPDSSASIPQIQNNAIETGINGSLTIIDGISTVNLGLQSRLFKQIADKSLLGFGGRIGFSHIRSLSQLDLEGNFSWQKPFTGSSVYYMFLVGGGLRYEWLGSFREALYPVGFNIGINALVSSRASFRFEYSFRRIFGNASSNFNEHRFGIGLSVFFRNK